MCGRYRLTAKERYLRDHFGLDEDPTWTARWNIAPTQLGSYRPADKYHDSALI
jgi:putative SOS response-associated peptidase YedK